MKKAVWSGVIAAAGVLFLSGTAYAQAATDTQTVTINANVQAKAKLSLDAASIAFPDEDPDAVAVIAADVPVNIDVKARTASNGSVTLTVAADGNLISGTNSIAIDNLKWTVSGSGLSAGTASTAAVTLGTWTGSGNRTGLAQNYTLQNSWAYNTGDYTAVLTYTLTAP
jgi:hypothetical protein